jgi:hypothetical protein
MRAFAVLRLIPLGLIPLGVLSLAGCVGTDRHEGFTATGPTSFLYSARTSTMMTENDDGEAERIRQGWLVAALKAHAMCTDGYIVDTRRFVPEAGTANGPQFGNGGDIVYAGRCIVPGVPPAPVAPPPPVPPVRG